MAVASYDIGQILFTLSHRDTRVMPVRVVEQITRRTIRGDEVTYNVETSRERSRIVDLSQLDVEVFATTDALRQHMLDNAKLAIDRLVDRAAVVAAELIVLTDDAAEKAIE